MFAEEFELPPAVLETFTILTCEPNDLLAQYHDRMPVMLEAQSARDWLDESESGPDDLMDKLEVRAADLP